MQKKTIKIMLLAVAVCFALIGPWILFGFGDPEKEQDGTSFLFSAWRVLLAVGWFLSFFFAGFGLKEIRGWKAHAFWKILFVFLFLIALTWAVVLALILCTFRIPS